jgi:hypothetical protein
MVFDIRWRGKPRSVSQVVYAIARADGPQPPARRRPGQAAERPLVRSSADDQSYAGAATSSKNRPSHRNGKRRTPEDPDLLLAASTHARINAGNSACVKRARTAPAKFAHPESATQQLQKTASEAWCEPYLKSTDRTAAPPTAQRRRPRALFDSRRLRVAWRPSRSSTCLARHARAPSRSSPNSGPQPRQPQHAWRSTGCTRFNYKGRASSRGKRKRQKRLHANTQFERQNLENELESDRKTGRANSETAESGTRDRVQKGGEERRMDLARSSCFESAPRAQSRSWQRTRR